MFHLDIRLQLADDDPLAHALRQTPLRQRGRVYTAWARLGLAAQILGDGQDVTQAWARLADRVSRMEQHLHELAAGHVSPDTPLPASQAPDAATIAAEHEDLIANMMAAFNIPASAAGSEEGEFSSL